MMIGFWVSFTFRPRGGGPKTPLALVVVRLILEFFQEATRDLRSQGLFRQGLAVPSPAATRSLDLPPPYTLVTLREAGDAFAHACRIAPEAGAGTLVWVGRFDVIEFAVVLEPEEPLQAARRAFFAGMTALADAVAAYCAPEKPLDFGWPDALRFDGALLGGGRLGWPENGPEDAVPDWLVFAAMLIAAKPRAGDPGLTPVSTSLEDEGFFDSGRATVESFSRHLMTAFDRLAEDGFDPIADRYLARLPKQRAADQRTIDPHGDLFVTNDARKAPPERLSLREALQTPSWLDPATGLPRL
jgi:Biotin/lipoate A/B protein ligase family